MEQTLRTLLTWTNKVRKHQFSDLGRQDLALELHVYLTHMFATLVA
jgi:hypothetical protein